MNMNGELNEKKPIMDWEIVNVIKYYPEIGKLLEQYGIGCVTCTVGTCLLKDVLNIHHIPQEDGTRLLGEMRQILNTSETLAWAPVEEKKPITRNDFSMNDADILELSPIEQLVMEHNHIKSVLSVIPVMLEAFRNKGEIDILLFAEVVSFVRNYADRYHHAKEEDILFRYAPENFPPIRAMLEEHEQGRNYIKNAEKAAYIGNLEEMSENLLNYRELLKGHIEREDTVLYPWFDRNTTEEKFMEMKEAFFAENKRFGDGYAADYEKWAESLLKTHNPHKN